LTHCFIKNRPQIQKLALLDMFFEFVLIKKQKA
jgi:hypothetical protein